MGAEKKFEESFQTNRYVVTERFLQPMALNGSSAYGKNTNVEFSGFSCAAGQSALSSGGGNLLSTFSGVSAGFSGFSGAIAVAQPSQVAGQSAFKVTNWSTSKAPRFEAIITTGASVASQMIWAGLKLTNVGTVATDDDQIYFYVDMTSGNWQIVNSRANVDVQTPTSIAVAANTRYRLVIEVQSDRTVKCWINDVACTVSPLAALTASINLIPFVGCEDLGGVSPVNITLQYLECGRDI